ncbi:hypothetical protein Hdeb2414_s0003g00107371 [Helianthus debilis subsp. tardiflorus]
MQSLESCVRGVESKLDEILFNLAKSIRWVSQVTGCRSFDHYNHEEMFTYAIPNYYVNCQEPKILNIYVKGNLKLKCSCLAHSQLVPFCWMDSQRLYLQGYV